MPRRSLHAKTTCRAPRGHCSRVVFLSTRRSFLALSSGAALASAWPKPLFSQETTSDLFSNRNLGAYTQGLLNKATFEAVVGSVFTLFFADGSTTALTLSSVKTSSARRSATSDAAAAAAGRTLSDTGIVSPNRPAPSCFLLTFSTGPKAVPQGTYRLDHGTLGSFAAFLVPGNPRQTGICTACFNYL